MSNIPQLPSSGHLVDFVQPLSANKTIPVSNIYALNTPEEVASNCDEKVGEQPVFRADGQLTGNWGRQSKRRVSETGTKAPKRVPFIRGAGSSRSFLLLTITTLRVPSTQALSNHNKGEGLQWTLK